MFGALTAISSGIQLGSGILSKIQHDKYANLIEEQDLEMPGSMGKAESIYSALASQGLPGKETIKSDIEGMMPANLSAAKEVVDSPSALIDLIGKTSAQTSDQMRKLGVNDASAKIQNQATLGRFLSTAKAPMEMDINKFDIERDLSAERERMAGWSELTQGVSGAANIGMKYFGDKANEEHMTGLMKMITGAGGEMAKAGVVDSSLGGGGVVDSSLGGGGVVDSSLGGGGVSDVIRGLPMKGSESIDNVGEFSKLLNQAVLKNERAGGSVQGLPMKGSESIDNVDEFSRVMEMAMFIKNIKGRNWLGL